MAMRQDGPWSVAIMWVLLGITLLFVILRVYTRVVLVRSYGLDDHVYLFAFVLLALYTIFVTLSAQHGFGVNMWDIEDPDEIVRAIFLEAIGQIFAVIGGAVAKVSLGLFLLRIVEQRWQVALIWTVVFLLVSTSIIEVCAFMLQCHPREYLWDRRIPGGYCDLPMTPISALFASTGIFADFFFALFPWLFIWQLQMNKREKLVILLSMSLGVIAGAFGIKRAVEIPSLSNENYLRATVGLVLWSSAEQCVTMVCIGIPICRPMYKRYLDQLLSTGDRSLSNNRYQKQGSGVDGNGTPLRTFGGGTMVGGHGGSGGGGSSSKKRDSSDAGLAAFGTSEESLSPQQKYVLGSPLSKARAVATGQTKINRDTSSDEEILTGEFRSQGYSSTAMTPGKNDVIHVREDYSVTRD